MWTASSWRRSRLRCGTRRKRSGRVCGTCTTCMRWRRSRRSGRGTSSTGGCRPGVRRRSQRSSTSCARRFGRRRWSSSRHSEYRAQQWRCRWLYRHSMSEPIEPASAAEAARELARVLLEQADSLDLHDLRATGAIENVRVQARTLANAVHEGGWGDIFLGIDSYDPDELDDLPLGPDDFDDPADYREMVEGDDLDELEEVLLPEDGVRLSYQARYDFVVTDPEAFVRYVRSRADEAQNEEVVDDIEDAQSAFELLCYLDGLGSKDYDQS